MSATLTGNGISPINLGTAEAGLDGQFAITVPNGVDIGAGGSGNGGSDDDDNDDDDNGDGGSTQTYTITVKSTYCPQNKGTVSITILPLRFSGCGSNDAGRTFSAGENLIWSLHAESFDRNKPVSLRLYKSGYSQVI